MCLEIQGLSSIKFGFNSDLATQIVSYKNIRESNPSYNQIGDVGAEYQQNAWNEEPRSSISYKCFLPKANSPRTSVKGRSSYFIKISLQKKKICLRTEIEGVANLKFKRELNAL